MVQTNFYQNLVVHVVFRNVKLKIIIIIFLNTVQLIINNRYIKTEIAYIYKDYYYQLLFYCYLVTCFQSFLSVSCTRVSVSDSDYKLRYYKYHNLIHVIVWYISIIILFYYVISIHVIRFSGKMWCSRWRHTFSSRLAKQIN